MSEQRGSLPTLSGSLIDDRPDLTLAEVCSLCRIPAERVHEMVDEGIVEPRGQDPLCWRFHWVGVYRIHCALRLQRDLGVNMAGAALALDLLDEIDALRTRLFRFER